MSDITTALLANEQRAHGGDEATATEVLLDSIRLIVRRAQLELRENPDPSSPWWFLVDPDAEFRT